MSHRGAGSQDRAALASLSVGALWSYPNASVRLGRLARFCAVGASGLLVNQALLGAFTEVGGIYYLWSALVATQGSSLWNFGFSEAWVFPDRGSRDGRLPRLGRFLLVNNGAFVVRGPMLFLLTSVVGIHYLVANLISLLALTLGRFVLADSWIWSPKRSPAFLHDAGSPP